MRGNPGPQGEPGASGIPGSKGDFGPLVCSHYFFSFTYILTYFHMTKGSTWPAWSTRRKGSDGLRL
jgi:hypothetical protein